MESRYQPHHFQEYSTIDTDSDSNEFDLYLSDVTSDDIDQIMMGVKRKQGDLRLRRLRELRDLKNRNVRIARITSMTPMTGISASIMRNTPLKMTPQAARTILSTIILFDEFGKYFYVP
jgi:hypothetical protein